MIEKTGASQECKCNEGEEEHGENKGAAEMEKKWMKERPRHQPEVIHYTSDTHSHLPPPPHSSPSLCSDMFFLLLPLSALLLFSPFPTLFLFFVPFFLFTFYLFFVSSFAVYFCVASQPTCRHFSPISSIVES